MFTTGQIATLAALSEKAVRLYADRGLLIARREGGGRRLFAPDQVRRARTIALLRAVDVPLADVAQILDDPDPSSRFDAMWAERRESVAAKEEYAAYVRSALAGAPMLPDGLTVQRHSVGDRVVLGIDGAARLDEMPVILPRLTGELFAALSTASVPVTDAVFVEIRSRTTESSPGSLRACAPFGGTMTPPAGMAITLDPAHEEVFVALDQALADQTPILVAVHDFLASLHGDARIGPNREVYLPTFGTDQEGPVMRIAVPVAWSGR